MWCKGFRYIGVPAENVDSAPAYAILGAVVVCGTTSVMYRLPAAFAMYGLLFRLRMASWTVVSAFVTARNGPLLTVKYRKLLEKLRTFRTVVVCLLVNLPIRYVNVIDLSWELVLLRVELSSSRLRKLMELRLALKLATLLSTVELLVSAISCYWTLVPCCVCRDLC